MAKTKNEMFTLIGNNLPDNTSGAITPEDIREVATQLADSMLYSAAGVREVELLRAASTVTQAPSALDTPLQVTFGAAQNSASNPVMLNASGVVTFNTAGTYIINLRLQYGRAAATGTSVLLSRFVSAGAQFGPTQAAKLIASDIVLASESRIIINAVAGQTIILQVMRDSSGTNFGGLYPQTVVASGWSAAPSAVIVVSRVEPV